MPKLGFTISPLTTATAASQAKYEANGIIAQYRIRVDDIRSVPNSTNAQFDTAAKDGYTFQIYQDATNYDLVVFSTTQGQVSSGARLLSALPANGNDVVIYIEATATALVTAVGTPDGTVIHSGSFGIGGWAGGAGTGNVALGGAAGDTPFHLDSYARFSAARTGDARFAKPLPSDADVLGGYYYSEGSGTTAADFKSGGTALTITNADWQAANGWEAAGGSTIHPGVLRRRRP